MKMIRAVGILTLVFPACLMASDWQPVAATYTVPVPERLEAFAEFTISDMKTRTRDGVKEYKYTLPLELTGIPQKVHFVPGEQNQVTESVCELAACKIKYHNLDIDQVAVESVLRAMDLSSSEFTARMEVSSTFFHDPEGIILFSEPMKY